MLTNTPDAIAHREAVIMFCDMADYSKLMSADEARAIELRKKTEAILKEQVAEHKGKVVQFYGDGSLSMFDSSLDALLCALHIQHEIFDIKDVALRIGLHRGDVAMEGNNIYGETVNIASRIESFCMPGAVLFSGRVFETTRQDPILTSRNLGAFQLKNIPGSIELHALTGSKLKVPTSVDLRGKGEKLQRSIAVLPFVNMSADSDNEYFSDGVSEEILNQLSKDDSLRVTARTSSFAFKGQNLDIRDIGRQLNADVVLEGSVRKSGDRVRITAQLIKTDDGYHLFSQSYDRTLNDIFAVQDEIALDIAENLKQSLGPSSGKKKKREKPTQNLEAYNDYLRGLFHWNKYEPTEVKKALQFLESAIEKDHDFAEAHSWISFCLSFLGGTEAIPGSIAFPRARKAAETAISLDPEVVEAHCALGLAYLFQDWDLIKSEECFNRAKAINRQSDTFLYTYSLFLKAAGRFVEAVEVLEESIVIDPVSLIANTYLADAYMNNLQFDLALKQINHTLELVPDSTMALLQKGWILTHRGDLEAAMKIVQEKIDQSDPLFSEFVSLRGHLWAKLGNMDRARSCKTRLDQLHETNPDLGLMHQRILIAYGIGDMMEVKALLDRNLNEYRGGMIFGLNHPFWAKIWADPKLAEFKKRFESEVRM
ncbi:MAG: adenylate/guanylate cyclase domain-containing protein [Saprospiraceae bacterium]|nr:adenylate/guanylate cyclase domain-containing protein [Saprospiraceae bacterium]